MSVSDFRGALILTTLLAVACPMRAQTLTTLYSFSGAQGSGSTQGPLVQDPDGNFYGAIQTGGTNRAGAIFRITPGGALTVLYNFSGPDGKYPSSGVTLGPDGNFYGTTYIGGTNAAPGYAFPNGVNGAGTIFRITPTGAFSVLHYFNGIDGEGPFTGLTLGPDGNFYGVANGGTYGLGTFFKITPTGTFSSLLSYTSGQPGPDSRLTLGSDGSFYGTTEYKNGTTIGGIISRITPGAVPTTLFSADGWFPSGPLAIGVDGNFYGTTSGGANGTVFRVTPTGTVTTLYSGAFGTLSGSPAPTGALTPDPDGNLYGMTSVGGSVGEGSVFVVTPSGVFTTVYSFSRTDGAVPNGGLTLGTDGNFYGMTSTGGMYNEGTVFKLVPGVPAAPAITSGGIVPVYSGAATIQAGEWVSIYGANLASSSAIWSGDFPMSLGGTSVTINGKAAYLWFVSPTQINLQAPDDTATGTVPVVVTTGSGSSTSTVTLAQFGPSFSLLNSKYAAAIVATPGSPGNSGGGYDIIGPLGAFSYPTRPVKAGEIVQLFGVGFGPTDSPVPAGHPFSGAAASVTLPLVTIGGVPATVSFGGIVEAGLFQFNVIVPNAGSGDQLLRATIGGAATPNNVYLTLQ